MWGLSMIEKAKEVGGYGEGSTTRPLRVEEKLGLGIIQSHRGQPLLVLQYGSRVQSKSEYGILIKEGGPS